MIETGSAAAPQGDGFEAVRGTARTTGRQIVVFAEDDDDPGGALSSIAGVRSLAESRDFEDQAVDMDQTAGADGTLFSELKIAVVDLDDDQLAATRVSSELRGRVLAVGPEYICHVMAATSDYARGYLEGVSDLAERIGASKAPRPAERAEDTASFEDSDQATWGLQATGVSTSTASGNGVRVAVLDTGLDLRHPDFNGRDIVTQSFVAGVSAQDGHGHGTHCIGTSCGPKAPSGSRRYGIAHGASIYVGKVLDDEGSGADGGILAGINWALANGCTIISMSLGADVSQPQPGYSAAGRRALARGTLIIAAAGNNANRPDDPGFVGAPANSPDVMAVAAVDSSLQIARFSARSFHRRGGQVDIAGPGVNVYSSWPGSVRYRTISGTSMATPHVAGLAALYAGTTGRRGMDLWGTMSKAALRLAEPSVDVGIGLASV